MAYFKKYNKNKLIRELNKRFKEGGVLEIIKSSLKFIKKYYLNFILKYLSKRKIFMVQNKKYLYYLHPKTHFNERAVEISILNKELLKYKNKKILEIGNVIKQYNLLCFNRL